MSTLENVIADAILILSTNVGYVAPHDVDVVEIVVAVITFVFLATQFTHACCFKEGYYIYLGPQNDLQR